MDVELLYFEDCPNWRVAARYLESLAVELGRFTVKYHIVETPEDAVRVGFRGSPTILVNGLDAFATAADPVGGLSCRAYATPDGLAGSPTMEQLREVFTSAS